MTLGGRLSPLLRVGSCTSALSLFYQRMSSHRRSDRTIKLTAGQTSGREQKW